MAEQQAKFKANVLMFDFGGCLDSSGLSMRNLFFNTFVDVKLLEEYDAPEFNEIFQDVDNEILKKGSATKLSLANLNQTIIKMLSKGLGVENQLGQLAEVGRRIINVQRRFLETNRGVLEKLASAGFTLGLVTNFYGNLKLVLDEFKLTPLFKFVIESYEFKKTKPDPAIFQAALAAAGVPAEECIFIGDSADEDIKPAIELGMQAFQVQAKNGRHKNDYRQTRAPNATYLLSELTALPDLVQKL